MRFWPCSHQGWSCPLTDVAAVCMCSRACVFVCMCHWLVSAQVHFRRSARHPGWSACIADDISPPPTPQALPIPEPQPQPRLQNSYRNRNHIRNCNSCPSHSPHHTSSNGSSHFDRLPPLPAPPPPTRFCNHPTLQPMQACRAETLVNTFAAQVLP